METKLKKVMDKENINQSELARRTRLARSAINEIVGGVLKNYRLSTLYEICKATGKTPNDILDYENEIK